MLLAGRTALHLLLRQHLDIYIYLLLHLYYFLLFRCRLFGGHEYWIFLEIQTHVVRVGPAMAGTGEGVGRSQQDGVRDQDTLLFVFTYHTMVVD